MRANAEALRVIRQWVEKAENDMTNATHTLTLGRNCPTDTVCFHAHQCVEKYLKTLLVYEGKDSSKTHYISELMGSCLRRCVPTYQPKNRNS